MSKMRLHFSDQPRSHDFIRIHYTKRKIEAGLTIFRYTDKDTRQIVLYVPGLELTAYGETNEKAEEMMRFSLEDAATHLLKLSSKNLATELRELGWKQDTFRNKEYSKSFVDANGELKNFAVDNKVEKLALTI